MDQSMRTFIVADVFAALVTHAWLKRYDPVHILKVLQVLAVIPLLVVSLGFGQRPPERLVLDVFQSYAIFYTTLSFSVIAYRLSPFHPLAKYPGPIVLKVSKLYFVWIAYTGKNHIYLKELHDKYGPTIRIGPNELSTSEKDLISGILGSQGMAKGPMWDARRFIQNKEEAKRPYRSIIDVRDPEIHSQLRKPWSKSFSAQPLQNYESLLLPRVLQLNRHLEKIVEESWNGVGLTDVAKWLSYFSFDFMGDIAFGTTFELMRDGDKHGQHRAVSEGMYYPSLVQHIPWFADVMRAVPMLSGGIQKLIGVGVTEGVKRSKKEIKHKDLFYYMAESADSSPNGLKMIIPNVVLAIIAGSDTSSSIMINTVQLLLSHPEECKRLQQEIDDAFNKHEIPDLDSDVEVNQFSDVLAGLKYLNGVINETLRLLPAVPTALQRSPPNGSGGRLLQGDGDLSVFLPEGNSILIPPYVIQRDPRYFSPRPDDFIPERWLSDPSYKTSRDAFLPFSFGPRNCVGRPLALIELRYVIATLFRNFNMEFDTSKYDATRWNEEILDRFTFENGHLDVKITLRTREMRGLK